MSSSNQAEPRLAPGTMIGRYRIRSMIGRGGMGEVYSAHDPELDRIIAVKVLRFESGDADRARLSREAQAIAKLSHPNVLVVYDVGAAGDKMFLAMEFVDGSTLTFWREVQNRSWREILQCFIQAGRGLEAAHKAGLVHRDFKPDNVMIGRDHQVRVMDFGLARSFGARAADDAAETPALPTPATPPATLALGGDELATRVVNVAVAPDAKPAIAPRATPTSATTRNTASALNSPLTEVGTLVGTPAYMSPEQFRGEPCDAASDQFSFCVTLYETLYGERPFAGNVLELPRKIANGEVREAPTGTSVPTWIRRILLRGLRAKPSDRFPSMEELLVALSRDPAQKRRRLIGSSAAIAVLAISSFVVKQSISRGRELCAGAGAHLADVWTPAHLGAVPDPRRTAVQRAFLASGKRYAGDAFTLVADALDRYTDGWAHMYREACEATHVRGDQSAEVLDLRMSCLNNRLAEARALTDVFTSATGDVVAAATEAVQALPPIEPCADVAALRAIVRPPDDPTIRRAVASTRERLASVKALTSAGSWKAALTSIPETETAARRTNYQPLIAEVLAQKGELQYLSGDATDSEKTYEDAAWRALASRDFELAARAGTALTYDVGLKQARYTDAERWASFSKASIDGITGNHDLLAAWLANNVAAVQLHEGHLADALDSFSLSLQLKTKVLGSEHFDVALTLGNIAVVKLQLGRIADAAADNQRAITMLRKTLGPDHPHLADHLAEAAEIANAQQRYAEAETMANAAVAIWERELGPRHPFLAAPLTAIGWSYFRRGQHDRAVEHLERALSLADQQDPEQLSDTRFALGCALSTRGTRASMTRALTLARQAIEGHQKTRHLHQVDDVRTLAAACEYDERANQREQASRL